MACAEQSIDMISEALQELKDVICLDKDLGRGAYGKVYTVKYSDAVYAAKEIHSLLVEIATAEEKRELRNNFLRECYSCSVLHHPNIVRFIGVYYPHGDRSIIPAMVMELMDDSLTNFVKKSDISLKMKSSILHDVAFGLSYLHCHHPPIIHRDLSPNNILMSSDMVAKISDLGVAKVLKADGKMTKNKFTQAPGCIDFMPPEALESTPYYSISLDIFSYGGIVLHVVNQEWPSPESQVRQSSRTDKLKALSEVQRRKRYLDEMKDGAEMLKPLVKLCLDNNAIKRPKIDVVFNMLEPFKAFAEKQDKVSTAVGLPRLYAIHCEDHQWPIVYKNSYNISFFEIEKLQSRDARVWDNVYQRLINANMLKKDQMDIVRPHKVNDDELLQVHTQEYLSSTKSSSSVSKILDMLPLAIVPFFLIKKTLLNPLRKQTGGTVLAGKLAKDRGWAINIGGGFHHCSSNMGGRFCAYADISLCVKFMFEHLDDINKVMILDLDAHQGNGYARDLGNDSRVFIFDTYNSCNYPNDEEAKEYIDIKIELAPYTADAEYLKEIKQHLPKALEHFKPDMVIYNAGSDVLVGDPFGKMEITKQGIKDRDEFVFTEVRAKRRIPILMLQGGGFQRSNAEVIANSIINLYSKGLIDGPK